jgi:aspartate racemase
MLSAETTRNPATSFCIGILGGMGPRATVDLFLKLVEATPAVVDRDHIPVVVYSVPQVPDRTEAILRGGPSPVGELRRGIYTLENAGASVIVVACNTAHHWFDEMQESARVPLLHIVDAAIDELQGVTRSGARVGLMGTSGTITSGVYGRRLAQAGFQIVVPYPGEQGDVDRGIALVKAGRSEEGAAHFRRVLDALIARDASTIVLACTEIPVALGAEHLSVPIIDATAALARYCVRYWRSRNDPS